MDLSYFLSSSNKKIIWDLLADSNYFDSFPSRSKNDVKLIFEQTLNNIYENKTSNDNLIDLNKKVVQNMILKRNAILRKEREIFNNNADINNPSGTIQQIYQRPTITENKRITAEEIRDVREKEFSRILESKQNEFNSIINSNKPKEIDFSDKVNDERIGNEMENLLSKIKAQREQELGITYSDQNTQNADEFIKNGNQTQNIPKKLIIDKDDNNIKIEPKKQVRFDENNNENITFLINDNENSLNEDNDISTVSFLTKLKTKKSLPAINNSQTNIDTNLNYDVIINDIKELKNEISTLKRLHLDSYDFIKNLSNQIYDLIPIIKNIDNELNKNKFEGFDSNENI